jgi:hypothetical protein
MPGADKRDKREGYAISKRDSGMKGDRDLVHKTHSEADKNAQSVRDSYSDSSKFSEFLRKLMRTS